MTTKIKTLAELLNDQIRDSDRITLTISPRKLELDLDLQKGFQGYEHASIIQRTDLFDIKYLAIFSEAFRTFLDEKYLTRITDSPILSALRNRIAEIKDEKKVEVYDKRRDEFYSRLISLTEKDRSYEEAEKSALFFADVFREKAKGYKADAP